MVTFAHRYVLLRLIVLLCISMQTLVCFAQAIATSNTVVNANAYVTTAIDDADASNEEIATPNAARAAATTLAQNQFVRNGKVRFIRVVHMMTATCLV